MRMCARNRGGVFAAFAIGAALSVLGSSEGRAQEKHAVSYRVSAANSKYVQQHAIDVGDVPGHQVRILEIHRTYPTDPPVYDGVRVVEEWIRGYSDYVNINGRAWGYRVFVLENGDRIFGQFDSVSQTSVTGMGERRSTNTNVTRLTGGTGKFRAIRGLFTSRSTFNPQTGYNDEQVEGEYWME